MEADDFITVEVKVIVKAFDQDLITIIAFDNLTVFKAVQGKEIMLLKISFHFLL